MERLQKYIDAFAALPEGCVEAEVNAVTTEETSVQCRAGAIDTCNAYEKNAIFLRAAGERTGTVYTEDIDDDPCKLISAALENAGYIDDPVRQPMRRGGVERVGQIGSEIGDTREIIDLSRRVSGLPGVESCNVTRTVRHCRVINSHGLDTSLDNAFYTVSLEFPGKGEDNFRVISRSAARLEEIDIEAMLEQQRREEALAHAELPYITLPAGRYDAMISANMTVNIMNTAWQLFVRKLMQNGRSCFAEGQEIGSPAFSVTDAAACPYTGYDFSIDAEGVRGAAATPVVRRGVLEQALTTLREGESTGNAGRDDLLSGVLHTELIPIPRNIYIEGGDAEPEALIAKMGTGIHLTYSLDEFHSTNPASGTFSIPCGGVYYEDGVAVGRVQQMNLYGRFADLFHGVEACGRDVAMKPMQTYNSYCFGGPSLLVRGASFAM